MTTVNSNTTRNTQCVWKLKILKNAKSVTSKLFWWRRSVFGLSLTSKIAWSEASKTRMLPVNANQFSFVFDHPFVDPWSWNENHPIQPNHSNFWTLTMQLLGALGPDKWCLIWGPLYFYLNVFFFFWWGTFTSMLLLYIHMWQNMPGAFL